MVGYISLEWSQRQPHHNRQPVTRRVEPAMRDGAGYHIIRLLAQQAEEEAAQQREQPHGQAKSYWPISGLNVCVAWIRPNKIDETISPGPKRTPII